MSDLLDLNIRPEIKKKAFDKRIALIDFLRGACLFLVFFDHLMFDFRDYLPQILKLVGYDAGFWMDFAKDFVPFYFASYTRLFVRELALMMFVLLSGISCAFSKSNAKRAIKMLMFAVALAFGSNLITVWFRQFPKDSPFLPGNATLVMNYNVIAVITSCVCVYACVERWSLKRIGIFTIFLAIFSILILSPLYLELKDEMFLFYPFFNPDNIFINGKPYYQSDYMPLFPYIIGFFLGVIIAKTYYKNPSEHLNHNYKWMKPICFVGRHSLVFYLAHQFVFVGIFVLIIMILGAI